MIEMENIIKCQDLFDHKLVEEVKAWRRYDLYHFGFIQDDIGNWKPNPKFKDRPLAKVA